MSLKCCIMVLGGCQTASSVRHSRFCLHATSPALAAAVELSRANRPILVRKYEAGCTQRRGTQQVSAAFGWVICSSWCSTTSENSVCMHEKERRCPTRVTPAKSSWRAPSLVTFCQCSFTGNGSLPAFYCTRAAVPVRFAHAVVTEIKK